MQSAAGPKCCVKDLKEANKVLEYAIETADRGITFKAGAIDWDDMIMCVITDASFAGEKEFMKQLLEAGAKLPEEYRSQGGRLNVLATPSLLAGDEGHIHIISFGSTIIKRVCRSTIQAETYALSGGVEWGDFLRAAIVDLAGLLDITRWYESACQSLRQVWFTDCNSGKEALLNPHGQKYSDKRLNIEVSGLRQILWRAPGEALGRPHVDDERPEAPTDEIRWIDTDVMIADPMTKIMEPDKLVAVMKTGYWNIEQPIESVLKKRAKQLARRKTKDDLAEHPVEEYDDSGERQYHGPQRYDIYTPDPSEDGSGDEANYRADDWSNNGSYYLHGT